MRGSVALRSGKKSGKETLAMVSGRLFLSRRSQKAVANVYNVCYYEFARFIKAFDAGDFLRGLVNCFHLQAVPPL